MCNIKVGTLNDTNIISLCEEGLLIEENFSKERVKQACYELRCSNIYYNLTHDRIPKEVKEKEYILIKPKQTLVVITKECLNLPSDILGRVLTKGVLFSIGILPINTYADPGFSGKLGIVLHNLSNSYLKIKPGEPIAKIEFTKLEQKVDKPYEGQHGYQTEIWPIKENMIMSEKEKKNNKEIGGPLKELEESYGTDFGNLANKVFKLQKNMTIFMLIYFIIMLIFIAILAGTNWINTTLSLTIGVLANAIILVITHFTFNIRS